MNLGRFFHQKNEFGKIFSSKKWLWGWAATAAAATAATAVEEFPVNTKILQGFVEASNVNVIEEMVAMIESVRLFEAYQKLIQSIDEADNQSVNTIGRVA